MKNHENISVARTKLDFAALTLEDFANFVEADRVKPDKLGVVRFEEEHEAITNYWLMVKGFIEDAQRALEEVEV